MNELEQLQQENKALRLALQAQQEINHYKQFFLARVAHELRSPLSSLMSLQQLILHDLCDNPAEEKAFLKDANAAAHKLLKMIDDLVTVAKIDYGKISLDCQPIALSDLLAELEHTITLPANNHHFTLNFDAPDSLPQFNGDRQKILWVLRNLIDRALIISPGYNGVIKLDGTVDHDQKNIVIHLHLPCPPTVWQSLPMAETATENQLFTHAANIHQTLSLSPALTWQLAQTIIEKMGSSVAIVPGSLCPNSIPQSLFIFRFPGVNPPPIIH